MKRAALYLRVSTLDQHPENQLPDMEALAKARGWSVVDRFVDHGVSGSLAHRPELDRLMDEARARRFDLVICWSVSRLGRSMVHAVVIMAELAQLGVDLVFHQQGLDTTSPIGRGIVALLAALAEAELEERRERTRAGLARVRSEGKSLGRPRKAAIPVEAVRLSRSHGEPWSRISGRLGIPESTLRRVCR